MDSLLQTSEYISSFSNNNALPNHGFENISNEIKKWVEKTQKTEISGPAKATKLL